MNPDPFMFSNNYQSCISDTHVAIPFGSDPSVASPDLRVMGFDGAPSDPATTFCRGWKLTAPVSSSLCDLKAMFTGSLSYDKATKILTLRIIDPVLSNAVRHTKPLWFFTPDEVVYEGINTDDLKRTLLAQNVSWLTNFASWGSMVEDLLTNDTQLPIKAGSPLVTIAGTTDDRVRTYVVRGRQTSWGPEHLDINLSSFLATFPEFFHSLSSHSLAELLQQVTWPLWSGGHIRYVEETSAATVTAAAHGGPAVDYFTDPTKPARDLKEAIQYASDYDTVLIADTSVYTEGEIIIDKPLTVTGLVHHDPTAAGFSPSSFPRIRPHGGSGRVFRIASSGNLPVAICHLTIEGGSTSSATVPTAIGGAGVAILDSDRVLIERCCIRNNTTSISSAGSTNFLTKLDALIASLSDSTKKTFLTILRGYIVSTGMPLSISNWALGGQSFGAGVCFGWSNGYIRKCLVKDNTVGGRGGGIAVVGYGWPTVEDCVISHNGPNTSGRRDGGGIALEVSIPDKVSRDLRISDILDGIIDYLRGMGVLDISEFLLRANFSSIANLPSIVTSDSEKKTLISVVLKAAIGTVKWNFFDEDHIELARNNYAYFNNNTVEHNDAQDDGGGIYASVLSRTVFTGNTVSNNEAHGGGGGGVRATMGSDIVLKNNIIYSNTCQGGTKGPGGGGLSLRNVGCEVYATPYGSAQINNNICTNWAGGGIFSETTDEGDVLAQKLPGMWQAILTEVFDFDKSRLLIKDGAEVKNNTATNTAHGKGGGIYVLRGNELGVRDLEIEIEDFNLNITGNTAHEASSQKMRLVDIDNGVDIGDTDADFTAQIDGTTFKYEN